MLFELRVKFCQTVFVSPKADPGALGSTADCYLNDESAQRSKRLWVTSRPLIGRPFGAVACGAHSIRPPGPLASLDNLPIRPRWPATLTNTWLRPDSSPR